MFVLKEISELSIPPVVRADIEKRLNVTLGGREASLDVDFLMDDLIGAQLFRVRPHPLTTGEFRASHILISDQDFIAVEILSWKPFRVFRIVAASMGARPKRLALQKLFADALDGPAVFV